MVISPKETPSSFFANSTSIPQTKRLNGRGLRLQPCLTPFSHLNKPVAWEELTLTLAVALIYICVCIRVLLRIPPSSYNWMRLQTVTIPKNLLPENGAFWRPFFCSVRCDRKTLTSRMLISYLHHRYHSFFVFV